MVILTSAYALDLSGVPTATLTIYQELVKRGHQVIVYSPLGGKLESQMNVVKNITGLPAPDIILGQHISCANELHAAFPNTPFLFYSHSIWLEPEQPPDFVANGYLAINEAVRDNLISKGVPKSKISIVRDSVDTVRFSPTQPLHKKLEQVLFISNYKKWTNFKMLDAACKKLGVNLICCGSPYGRSYKIEEAINAADLVVSWGRGILEGMSCGRAVVSFEKLMGDGYITPAGYFKSRRDNFCGFISKRTFATAEDLAEELSKYNSNCIKINRNLIFKHHNVTNQVDQLLIHFKKYGHA